MTGLGHQHGGYDPQKSPVVPDGFCAGSRATAACWREAAMWSGKRMGLFSWQWSMLSKPMVGNDTKMQNYADVGVTYYDLQPGVHSTSQTQSLRGVSLVNAGASTIRVSHFGWRLAGIGRGQGTHRQNRNLNNERQRTRPQQLNMNGSGRNRSDAREERIAGLRGGNQPHDFWLFAR